MFEDNQNDLDVLAGYSIDDMLVSSELCDSFNLQDLEDE